MILSYINLSRLLISICDFFLGKTLIIRHVDFEDEGLYQCEASNVNGQTPKRHQIQVEVQAKPRFKVFFVFLRFL